jgi:uncharacterized membrane protein
MPCQQFSEGLIRMRIYNVSVWLLCFIKYQHKFKISIHDKLGTARFYNVSLFVVPTAVYNATIF